LSIKFIDSVIDVKNLNYKSIIKNISFNVKRGDYTAIIGPNGGGKSTLLRLVLGLIKPTSGEIKLFNSSKKDFKDSYKIGYVPQRAAQLDLNFPITVYEVVKLGLAYKSSLFKSISSVDKQHIEDIMEKVGITHLRDRLVSQLSGGQRQRVMIARALVSRPQILILDEPNTGVDTHAQKIFYDFLRELNQKEKITILFVTHDLGVIVDDVTNVLCINQSLLPCQNPHEILNCTDMSKLYGVDTHVMHHNH